MIPKLYTHLDFRIDMSAERALMFVHMGMDVENQWEKAVQMLGGMSNLEVALVWRRFSELVPMDDFKMHSEYKCLFKRAVREAEGRNGAGGGGSKRVGRLGVVNEGSYMYPDNISNLNFGSDGYEFDRDSCGHSVRYQRGNSGFSITESQHEAEREKKYDKVLAAIVKYGFHVNMGGKAVGAMSNASQPTQDDLSEYCEALISAIAENGMDERTKDALIQKINGKPLMI
jgi:hypothetical protein